MAGSTARYVATLSTSLEAFLDLAAVPGHAPTPFQTRHWLENWYRHLARDGHEPVLVEVRDAAGAFAFGLPLVLDRSGGNAVIRFADRCVSDYNMPLIGPAAPRNPVEARAAWEAVSTALPRADLCVFEKMPAEYDGAVNPLVMALDSNVSHLFGSYIRFTDDLEDWRKALGRHHRKELGRFWRVFARDDSARFVRAADAAEALRILTWIEENQSARSGEMGFDYQLDKPGFKDLYRALLDGGIERGEIIVTALMAGEEIVAGLYGVADGTHYGMVRIATAGGEWSNCSPGRLVIERTINLLHAEGYRWIDFTIGDYAYKRRFETVPTPLYDVTLARSLRGLPRSALTRAKAYVKHNPMLERLARRAMAMRRPASAPPVAEEDHAKAS
jgi:CelD/BcsL family acetyltransferase involved in cellulose biosynthesis